MGPLHARGSGSKLGGAHGSSARPSHASGSGTQRRVLIGPYEVEHRLSDRGGRARFVVQRPGLSSQCLLHLYATLPPTAQDLLRERLSACSRVTHRALAATLEVGQEGGRIYVVREHVEGTPLSQVLLDDPPSVERALRWTLSAGEALLLLAGSEVDVAKLDLEGVVLDGERVCLLEVGLDLERALGGSSAALVELLASLLHGGPVGAQLPRRPRAVPARLWRTLREAHASPPPLAQLLGALRSELDGGAGHTARAPALALWIAAGVLLLASVAAAAFAASWTREARSRARDLQELNAELAAAEQALEQVQRDVATAQAQRPDPVSPPTDLGQLRQVDAWVELHAATLEPRLVGRELLLGWVRLLPESPASMELQGRYAFYLGRIPQAVELYARASRADALSPPAAALYALCLSMLGRNEEAQRELVELSKREPCPEALWAQGLLQPAQRQQLLREAAEQAPLSPAIQHTVVPGPRPAPPRERQALLERWDQLVRAHPAWESAVYRRSYAAYSDWLQSQRVSEALVLAYMRDLKIARDLNPNPAYWLYEGKSYVETGRPWLALGPLEATKRLLPSGSAPILAEFMTWELVALGQTGKTQAAVRVLEALERVSAQAADMAVRVLRERDPKAASELDHARAEGGR